MIAAWALLPTWYQYGLVLVFGAIIGSFINVVAYRMHTGVSLSGRSRCFSCSKTLVWYELVPFVSYVSQGGRCRGCSSRIPRRDFWVELVTAGVFLLVFLNSSSVLMGAVLAVLATILVLVVIYDLVHLIIPNELVVLIALLALIPLGLTIVDSGSYQAVFTAVLSSVASVSVYLLLWFMSHGRWIGFGDVKLAAALGLWLTAGSALSMVIFSFWVGALIGSTLLLPALWVRMRTYLYPRLDTATPAASYTMKSEIPFAPFIVIAFGMVYLYEISSLSFITSIMDVFI